MLSCDYLHAGLKYFPVLVLQITAFSACVYISCFGEAKREMDTVDRSVYYTFCHNTRLIHTPKVLYFISYAENPSSKRS